MRVDEKYFDFVKCMFDTVDSIHEESWREIINIYNRNNPDEKQVDFGTIDRTAIRFTESEFSDAVVLTDDYKLTLVIQDKSVMLEMFDITKKYHRAVEARAHFIYCISVFKYPHLDGKAFSMDVNGFIKER